MPGDPPAVGHDEMSRFKRRALRELDRQAIAHATISQHQLRFVIRIDADRWKQNRDRCARANYCAQSNTTIRAGCEVARPTACEIVTHDSERPYVVMELVERRDFELLETFRDKPTELREYPAASTCSRMLTL